MSIAEYIKCFIAMCNENSGFISFVLSALTFIVTTIAVFVAIYAAKLPFKRELKIYTMLNEYPNDVHILDVLLLNTGNSILYIEDIRVSQPDVLPHCDLGSLDAKLPQKARIITPAVPQTYRIKFDNYDPTDQTHFSHLIKIEVRTTQKTFKTKTDWSYG